MPAAVHRAAVNTVCLKSQNAHAASKRCVRTFLVFKFIRMSNFRLSVMGVYSCIHAVFSGVMRF
jgi:hypothetical protein